MRISEDYRKTATFLLVELDDDNVVGIKRKAPVATAFFVFHELNIKPHFVLYAVTARHNISYSRQHGSIYIRINTIDGGYIDYETTPDQWKEHDSTDVAIVEISPKQDWDVKAMPSIWLATDEFVSKNDVGNGDEVFFIGLFQQHPGLERALPIVRFGNISMMPDEPVSVEVTPNHYVRVDAYLVESRSWGGHSGSPVFAYFPMDRNPRRLRLHTPPTRILGLVSAHFGIPTQVHHTGDVVGYSSVDINSGIAVIIPAQEVMSLIMRPDVAERRLEIERTLEQFLQPKSPDVEME